MPLHGWIIYNGHLPGDKFKDFANWLQHAAEQKNIATSLIENNDLLVWLQTGQLGFLNQTSPLPDFVLFTDKDIYLARQLEAIGLRVFNSAAAIANTDDKIATYQFLAAANIPIPATVIAPKLFPGAVLNQSSMQYAIETFGFPFIIKEMENKRSL